MAQVLTQLDRNIIRRMSRASFWSFTGTAMAKFLSLAAGIVCANILTKEQYGQLGIVRSTINMFVVFGSAGLGVTLTRYISFYLHNEKERITKIYSDASLLGLVAGLAFSIAVFASADVIAEHFLNEEHLSLAVRIGAVLLFFTILNGVQNGALMGFEDYKHISYNNLIGGVFEFVFMVVGAYYYGVEGALIGFGAGFVIIYLCNTSSIRSNFRSHAIRFRNVSTKKEKIDTEILTKYTIPAALSTITITPTYWIVRTILINNAGYEELALYEAADQWKIIILYIPMAISQIALPILSSIVKERKDYQNTVILNTLLVGVISLLFIVVTNLFSPYFLSLFGSTYCDTAPINILAWSTLFSSTANVLEMMLFSKEKIWLCLCINVLWGVVAILLTYIFVCNMNLGASGISYSILMSYIFSFTAFSATSFFVL